MLATLSLFAVKSCAASTGVIEPKNSDAAFELSYYTNSQIPIPTSKGEGYFVAYKVYDETPSDELHFLKWSEGNISKYDDIEIRLSFTEKSEQKVFIEFNITNTGYFSKKIDLGVFADVDFANDNSTIALLENKKGFYMKGQQSSQYVSIYTTNEGYYPHVDTIYIADNNETTDITKYPYFENTTVEATEGDSVFAFSWMSREVQAGESLILGFASKSNKNRFKELPRVVEVSEKKEYYTENEETEIAIKVFNDEGNTRNDEYTLIAAFSNSSQWESGKVSFEAHTSVMEFTIPVNVGTGPILNYTIWAQTCYKVNSKDKSKTCFESNINATGKFVVSSPPTFEVTTPPKREYNVGENISVTATSNGVSFKYKFNNGRIEESSSANYDIAIPEAVKPGKNYTLTLWAQNQYGVKSVPKMYNISYIRSVQEGDEPKTENTTGGEQTDGEPKDSEPADGEPKTEDPKDGEPKTEDPKDGEPKTEDPKDGEPKTEDPKDGEPKTEDPKDGEPKTEDPKDGEPKTEDPKDGEPKTEDPNGGGRDNSLKNGPSNSKDGKPNLLAILLPIIFAVLIIIIIIVVIAVVYKKKHPAPQDEYNGKAVPVTDSGANEENYFEP